MTPDVTDIHATTDHLFRREAGQMVARLTRVLGVEHLQLAEDSVQDALVQALRRWPFHGLPENPSAWLRTVAKNRALDRLRRGQSWRHKVEILKSEPLVSENPRLVEPSHATFSREVRDDQLRMIFACCHPTLTRDAQVGLTLSTVGGFSAAEVARAFLTPTPTVAQRLVRAKRKLKAGGVALEIPPPEALPARLEPVHEVIYLMFNEGYSAHRGEDLVRHDLCIEAIRLGALLAANPQTATPTGSALSALMHFQAARTATRVDAAGDLMLLAQQDRSRWDQQLIQRGVRHLSQAASGERLTRYHLEAEIAACHTLAKTASETDWPNILRAYDCLLARHPTPVIALNRVIALAEVEGPEAALLALDQVEPHGSLDGYYPAHATRASLLERLGKAAEAATAFDAALKWVESAPVRRFLTRRRAALRQAHRTP